MTANGWLQIAIFFLLILACAKPLGSFIATVIEGRKNFLTPVLGPVERLIYRICGVTRRTEEQHWTRYAGALLAFSAFSAVLLYAIQRLQTLASVQSAGLRRGQCQSGSRLQHGGQLHDEHELAELHAGNDAELLRADGRPDGA